MKKRDKGITLIALIITIIILLILAGISISSLTQTGLFAKAQEAKEKTEQKTVEENATLNEYEQWIANYVGGGSTSGGETLASKLQVGEYVTYTPDPVAKIDGSYTGLISELGTYSGNMDTTKNTADTISQETGLKWRVLDKVKDAQGNDCIRLISEVPTTSKVALEGYNGYNNAVYLLDKTCKTLYSKAGYSENVQNLKIEDIQKYMTITDYSTILSNYGNTFTPTNKKYPSIFAQEKDQTITGITQPTTRLDLSEQTTPINETTSQEASSWTVKYTYWVKSMKESDFRNPIYYNLFINNGNNYSPYYLSSRCVSASYSYTMFNVRYISAGDVDVALMCYSNGENYGDAYALRPVITLKSNVLLKSGNGTSETPYEIGF